MLTRFPPPGTYTERNLVMSCHTPGRVVTYALALILIATNTGTAGTLVDDFDANVDGTIYAVTSHPNGGLVIGGMFTTVGGEPSPRIARLGETGAFVESFTPQNGASSTVFALAAQDDGKILVGGAFTRIGVSNRNRIARLHTVGSTDHSFNPPEGADDTVRALLVQPDGRILVSGQFANIGGEPRVYLARLLEDGTVDEGFDAGFEYGTWFGASFTVNTLALQADGRIIAGGFFITNVHGKTRSHLARFHADGSLDESFNPAPDNTVTDLAVQPDGRIIVSGGFASIGGKARARIARLLPCGTLDASFSPEVEGPSVNAIALLPDGRITLGGGFTSVNGTPRQRMARLHPDGSLDKGFNPGTNGSVHCMIFHQVAPPNTQGYPDRIVAAGNFTSMGGKTRNSIAAVSATAALDAGYKPEPDGRVLAIAVSKDQRVILGGEFGSMGSTPRSRIARLNPAGTLDPHFNPGANGTVLTVAQQPDGLLLVGGSFGTIASTTRPFLARLHADGTIDSGFSPDPDGIVRAIALQDNGAIVVGGEFTHIAGQGRLHIARLNANGSLDTDFHAETNGVVHSILIQRNGGILLAGEFTQVNGSTRPHLARLHSDGTLDTSFVAHPNDQVSCLYEKPNGLLLVGGKFTAFGATQRNRLALLGSNGLLLSGFNPNANDEVFSIALLQDGKILVGGSFSEIGGAPRGGLARLHGDGLLDDAYDIPITGKIHGLAVQDNGGLIVGGSMHHNGSPDPQYLVRVTPSSFPRYQLQIELPQGSIKWFRSGCGPEPQRVIFEGSNASGGWTHLGEGEAFTDLTGKGWHMTDSSINFDSLGALRARALYPGGVNNASQSMHVATLWLRDLPYHGPFRVTRVDRGPPVVIHVHPWLPDMRYTLQYRQCLTTGEWADIPGQILVPGGGDPLQDDSSQESDRAFYRVRIETPSP